MVFLLLSASMAFGPVQVGNGFRLDNDGIIQGVVDTPTGTVVVSEYGIRSVVNNRSSFQPHVFQFQPQFDPSIPTGCDFDYDGRDEAPDFSVILNWRADMRDVVTGDIVVSLEQPFPGLYLTAVRCGDIDGDGTLDAIGDVGDSGTTDRWLTVWNDDGSVRSLVPFDGARELFSLGQFDSDPALEIITDDGLVWDGATLQVDDTLPNVPNFLAIADVDGDGIDERLSQYNGRFWRMEDAQHAVLWRIDAQGAGIVEDFDGDGNVEVVLTMQPLIANASMRQTYDAATGQPIGQPYAMEGWPIWSTDFDNDGRREITTKFMKSAAIDPLTGDRIRYESQGNSWVPTAGDVDGDGLDDVLWSSSLPNEDRLVLRDRTGNWMDMLPIDITQERSSSLHDVDGDGDMEIVRGDLRVWDWSAATGFVAIAPLPVQVDNLGEIDVVADLDGDGDLDVLYRDFDEIWAFDAGTATAVLIGESRERVEVADVDGDGIHEVLISHYSPRASTRWVELDGQELSSQFASRATLLGDGPSPRWLTCSRTGCGIYAWNNGPELVLDVAPPRGLNTLNGLFEFTHGRLWYFTRTHTRSFDPVSGDVYRHPSLDPAGSLAIASGYSWFPTDNGSYIGRPLR